MMFPFTHILFFALALVALSTRALHAADRSSTPNVVLIFCDDLGYGDIGSFGAKGYTTPNLDRLAKNGVRFTNFHVSQAVCSASRAALMTGCYNNRIGIHGALGPGGQVGLNKDEVTMAELFKQKGYATGMSGKWHLGDAPQFLPVHHGFDEYYGLPYSNDMWPHHPEMKANLAKAEANANKPNAKKGEEPKKRKGFPPLPMIEGDKIIDPEVTPEEQEQLTTQYTERAVKFIEKNKDKPFFFYLAHSMPHVPLYVSSKFKGKSERGVFGDVIMEIDWSVGEVMKALETAGIEKDTIVIFTSDNGPWLSYGTHAGSSGPLKEGKGTSWEGGIRVPFIARWPGKIPADSECREPAMTIDLFPSFAKVIGAALPSHKIDGLDITEMLENPKDAKCPHPFYFTYYANNQLQAVMGGQWKLVLPHTYRTLGGRTGGEGGKPAPYTNAQAELALYDLYNDAGETMNVADKHPEVVARLQGYAESAREDLGDSLQKRAGTGTREPGRRAPQKAQRKQDAVGR
jgi:arylsulfatase